MYGQQQSGQFNQFGNAFGQSSQAHYAEQQRQFEEQMRRAQAYNEAMYGWQERQSAVPPLRKQSTTLSKDLLRKLIMLCHPDKHSGSDMANSVTIELLKLREEMK